MCLHLIYVLRKEDSKVRVNLNISYGLKDACLFVAVLIFSTATIETKTRTKNKTNKQILCAVLLLDLLTYILFVYK